MNGEARICLCIYIPNNVGKCKVMLKADLDCMMQPPYDTLTKPYDNRGLKSVVSIS